MNLALTYIRSIYFDLISGFQFSSKAKSDFFVPIEVIKILIIWAAVSIPSILAFSFFLGFFRLPLKPSEFLSLDIFISILILFKIILIKRYPLRKVFKLDLLKFKLLFPIVLIGIGLSIANIELEYIARLAIGLVSNTNIIYIGESRQLLEMNKWMYFLYVVISAPILEELVFRGLILTSIENSNGIIKAVVYTSLAFAISHIYLSNVFSIFMISIVTAIIVIRTNSIISGILIHIINNYFNFYFVRLRNIDEFSKTFSSVTDSVYLQPLSSLILSIILLFIGFVWFRKNINQIRTTSRNEVGVSNP